jgi:hypothetical protein
VTKRIIRRTGDDNSTLPVHEPTAKPVKVEKLKGMNKKERKREEGGEGRERERERERECV